MTILAFFTVVIPGLLLVEALWKMGKWDRLPSWKVKKQVARKAFDLITTHDSLGMKAVSVGLLFGLASAFIMHNEKLFFSYLFIGLICAFGWGVGEVMKELDAIIERQKNEPTPQMGALGASPAPPDSAALNYDPARFGRSPIVTPPPPRKG